MIGLGSDTQIGLKTLETILIVAIPETYRSHCVAEMGKGGEAEPLRREVLGHLNSKDWEEMERG